ncbi:site-specific integrase [Brucepastera parasyntrophica]|uniref:tyrosine-type recombinase/integrase n=1 Tax=Brucepastera parasyntrophica TaxID=2880008 RepID=UPI00210E776C|nr:site-specific integrase [Brucepastera parasyntrophica]ULQ59171.1 site-specific integrase [Brucepastera parasyntrophica]
MKTSSLPFSITKPSDRSYYYVAFKNEKTGRYSTKISTRQKVKSEAVKTAYDWYVNGIPQKDKTINIEKMTVFESVKNTDFSSDDAESLIKILKKKGLIKSAVITGSKQDIELEQFMLDFWTFDKSPYVKEKLRKNHSIHRRYVARQYGAVKNYWVPHFRGYLLGSLTKTSINEFMAGFEESDLSASGKNGIIRAGTIALKWAYEKELIEHDITNGLTWFAGMSQERNILTPEIARAVFSMQWHDERAKLANMLAMVTGLRAGEIQGLRIRDMRADCLNVQHSWNLADGLKVTKNKEHRIVELPFPSIMQGLVQLAELNPWNEGIDGYIFFSPKKAHKPIEATMWLKALRQALQAIGMSETEAKQIDFHSWRHYFTTYMREKVNEKVLRGQTGHKTVPMLEHYSDHRLPGDKNQLQQAQIEAFGILCLPINTNRKFCHPEILDYSSKPYLNIKTGAV